MEKITDASRKIWKRTPIQKSFIKNYQEKVLSSLEQDEILDIIENKTVVVDLSIRKVKRSWDKKIEMNMNTISGLPQWLNIQNPDVLVQFCRIHWFFPIIRNIYLDNIDISKVEFLPHLMDLFFWLIKNWDINFALNSELSKIVDLMEQNGLDSYDIWDLFYIFSIFRNVRSVGAWDVPHSFWPNLQKNRNVWTFSENIFCEIAFRLENEVRNAFGIYATYLNLASMRDDTEKKIDMWFSINNIDSWGDGYKELPVQFTTTNTWRWTFSKNDNKGVRYSLKKLERIEKKLFEEEFRSRYNFPFVVLFVNWDFSKVVGKDDFLESYRNWISNKETREEQSISKFPFFINTMDQEGLVAPKVWYIVLNAIFSQLKFKKYFKWLRQIKDYISGLQQEIDGFIEDMEWVKIWWVYMDKIWISIDDIQTVKSPNPKQKFYLTYYDITFTYKWKKQWAVRIYL